MKRFNICQKSGVRWSVIATISFNAALFLFAATGVAISSDDAFLLEPADIETLVVPTVESAELTLPNGNEVHFTPLYNAKGTLHSVAISERVRYGNPSAIEDLRIAGNNARMLFYALSPERTPIPRFLPADRSTPEPTEPQGWARTLFESKDKDRSSSDQLSTGLISGEAPLPCFEAAQPFEEIVDEVDMFGYTFSYKGEGISRDTFPQYWQEHEAPASYESHLFELYGAVHNVEAFYSTVVACAIFYDDVYGLQDAWYPESVEYQYRIGAGGFTGTGQHIVVGGDKVAFYWTRSSNDSMPYGIDVAPDESIDFRLHIKNASKRDTFHIGATWSKPFDSFKSSE